MADVTQQQVVEYIKGISVLELSELVKTLEEELGVSAAAMPVAMPGGAGVAAGGAAAAEEQTEFTVTLTDNRREKDQRDQGGARGDEPGLEGSQGPRGECAEAGQGRHPQGRGRGGQEEVRGSRRQGRGELKEAGTSRPSCL